MNGSISDRSRLRPLAYMVAIGCVFAACSSDDSSTEGKKDAGADAAKGGGGTGGTGKGGSGGTGGTSVTGGGTSGTGGSVTGGTTGTGGSVTGGTTGTGGSVTGGTTGTGGSPTADGGQPIGSLCANDTNCNQSQGTTVCCAVQGCSGPCECQLEANCPGSTPFLPCQTGADCDKFGGGKVCCETKVGSSTMRFCTKPNGCTGKVIP